MRRKRRRAGAIVVVAVVVVVVVAAVAAVAAAVAQVRGRLVDRPVSSSFRPSALEEAAVAADAEFAFFRRSSWAVFR